MMAVPMLLLVLLACLHCGAANNSDYDYALSAYLNMLKVLREAEAEIGRVVTKPAAGAGNGGKRRFNRTI